MYLPNFLPSSIQKKLSSFQINRKLNKFNRKPLTPLGLADEEIAEAFEKASKLSNNEAFLVAEEALKKAGLAEVFFAEQKLSAELLEKGAMLEMKTGEGKTLAFALAASLIAKKQGFKVTVVTANDYLSMRDYNTLKGFYALLGVSAGYVSGSSTKAERQAAYQKDVVYTTIRESAYDYLRDNAASTKDDLMLPIRDFLLVDEADDILVDNASQPYVISSNIDIDEKEIIAIKDFAIQASLADSDEDGEDAHYLKKDSKVELTDKGYEALEGFLRKHNILKNDSSVYNIENLPTIRLAENAGTVIKTYIEGRHYSIVDNKIVVMDATGRGLRGVSFSGGLQQILEAKHNLPFTEEKISTDSILTDSLIKKFGENVAKGGFAGMSGTLTQEADELMSSYGKQVFAIPTRKPCARIDHADVFFTTMREKTRFALERTVEAYKKGQPVLFCATSDNEAERVSKALLASNVKNRLITSLTHAEEASAIALAGVPHSVTVTTAMTGRGTDIVLGGNLAHFYPNDDAPNEAVIEQLDYEKKAKNAGGLLVIGFGRQSMKKLDDQLRGRAGRQGDIGESIFVNSLEDNILTSEAKTLGRVCSMMNVGEKDMLSHSVITKALDRAQKNTRGEILKAKKAHAQHARVIENAQNALNDIRRELLLANEKNYPALVREFFDISPDTTVSKAELLQHFDDARYSFYVAVNDHLKNVVWTSLANKRPELEIIRLIHGEYVNALEAVSNAMSPEIGNNN